MLLFLMPASGVLAQSDNANPRAFGAGEPASLRDLPPGQFKQSLRALPPAARGKALGILQSMSFSELDLEFLRVDAEGGVYYADTFLPEDVAGGESGGDAPLSQAIPASETFLLHSRPGAPHTLYLDFDGHVITGTAWNGGRADPLYATAFNPSNDDVQLTACNRGSGTAPVWQVNFSATELERIGEIWHRVAEDFAPWNVDVTTEEPASFDRYTGRLLFTDDADYCGDAMPSQGAGGVAYVVVYGNSNYHTYYSPALVYWSNLSGGAANTNAEAGSHELGHNLGLAHDGTTTSSYYTGHGSSDSSPVDLVSWAPIMGAGYYRNVTQWSKNDYPNAVLGGTYQSNADDLAVLTSELGLRADDHGDSIASATALLVAGDGSISVTNPETDPHDFAPENKGVIETRNDLDFFYFDTGAGTVSLTVEPAWAAFYRATTRRGANLDIEARLYDGSGTLLDVDDPLDDTDAHLSATVSAGRYYVSVDGVGNPGNTLDPNNTNHGYDDYASLGLYFVSGQVQPTSTDTDPPQPDPMGWAVEPYTVSSSSIGMTATTATDATGPVQYRFNCVAGGGNCTGSAWQSGTSWTATGLDPSTAYTFTVQARDAVLNTTGASVARAATTAAPPPAAPGNFNASAASQTQVDLSWTDNSGDEDGFNLRRSTDQANWTDLADLPANATSTTDSGLQPDTQYFYELRAFSNANGASSWVAANATTPVAPPDAAPSGLVATGVSTSQIDLSWNDNASNETSYRVEHSQDGSSFTVAATLGANATSWSDTGLAASQTWFYRVYAVNGGGEAGPASAQGATLDPPPEVDYHAQGELTGAGVVSGSYLDTQADDGQAQTLTETNSGGRKRDRTSLLEHTWQFNIGSGDTVSVQANAWRSASGDGDAFEFAWSTDQQNWTPLFTVDTTDSANVAMGSMPNTVSGTVYLRVVDTDRTAGNASSFDSLHVDELFIRVVNLGPPTLPDAPTALSATAGGDTSIDLAWADNAHNESGFEVERSPDGASWSQVASLGAQVEAWTDQGLAPETTYHYRVRAWNSVGDSGWSNTDSAVTDPESTAELLLVVSASKVKGVKVFDLSWSGAGSADVDVYRDGQLIATTANDGAFTDNSGLKGGGSHSHQVCEAGTATCSNAVTSQF